ncbi:MAG TPA: glycoside hydrolase family 20 zincin-like fold domain-containing protein, partial [Verrucomicrobiae bacterium]|nr:glycoside hydrolase family 20 zincin-like fold domain-containing protein [Verrucomicrobiae bacterium]
MKLNLLPCPRSLKLTGGTLTLPEKTAQLILGSARAPCAKFSALAEHTKAPLIRVTQDATDEASATTRDGARAPEFYALTISNSGIEIQFRETVGLRAATATLRQLFRQYGRRLPCLKIRDWPDFARRGVMLDISRGRVPKLETLLELVEHL